MVVGHELGARENRDPDRPRRPPRHEPADEEHHIDAPDAGEHVLDEPLVTRLHRTREHQRPADLLGDADRAVRSFFLDHARHEQQVIILDITIAMHLVELENKWKLRSSGVLHQPWVISTGVVLILFAVNYASFIKPALDRSIFSIPKSYEKYYFLLKYGRGQLAVALVGMFAPVLF
jgi:hypothetical protein